ncbi:hypothetical protein AB0C84_44870 [Actinomadura sp. NPDC048955]|uniref:hypothetical protein n=1 Tax=Actinomadura sp. NPDC048955 TaxID=3158228 RepID=UPI0033C1C993
MMSTHEPEFPTDQPVVFPRGALSLLARVDLTPTALRVLMMLIDHHDPETGVAKLSQNELVAAGAGAKQQVNTAIRALREANLVTEAGYGSYTLHPLLTDGATPSPVTEVPVISALDPQRFSEVRRHRYAKQGQAILLARRLNRQRLRAAVPHNA